MLHFAIAFMVIALSAGMVGFGGPAGAVAVAQPVFFVFVLMALGSLAISMTRRN